MKSRSLFKVSRDELGRVLLHSTLGLLTCLLGYASWWLALMFCTGFIVYELDQDWKIGDNAYTDIKGFLWGLGMGGVIMFSFKLGGIL